MTDGDALRRAIVAQPDDDTLRLVYADWLDENTQPDRAAFIRAQVWATRAEPDSPDARKHAATATRLLDRHIGEWTRHVRQRLLEWRFARGFIEHASVNVATFPRDAAMLFAAEPLRSVQPVRFASALGPTVSLAPFFDTPQLTHLTHLDITGLQIAPVELDPLTVCPHLANLTSLSLRGTPVMPDWLTTLLVGPSFPALSALDLSDITHLGPVSRTCFPAPITAASCGSTSAASCSRPIRFSATLASRCVQRGGRTARWRWLPGTGRPEAALTHLDLGWVIPWERLRLLDLNAARGSATTG